MLNGNITKKIEEEKELRSSTTSRNGGDIPMISPMQFLRSSFASARPSLHDLEQQHNNATTSMAVSPPWSTGGLSDTTPQQLNNHNATDSSGRSSEASAVSHSSSNVPSVKSSTPIPGSASVSSSLRESSLHPSVSASAPASPPQGLSPKRGEGIFNKVAQQPSSSSAAHGKDK